MNKIELIKHERDGLDVKQLIVEYARTGWESITEGDVQRLKWYGLFRSSVRQPECVMHSFCWGSGSTILLLSESWAE